MKNSKKKIKVIFLDIDGVVNCAKTAQRHRGVIGIDPYMAFMVGQIILETDAKIVLSSTWRLGEESRKEVESQVHKLYDVTPDLPEFRERGHEIGAWLDKHPEVERYAILDDDSDMLEEQLPNFFKTTWEEGLTEKIKLDVINHLNKYDKQNRGDDVEVIPTKKN